MSKGKHALDNELGFGNKYIKIDKVFCQKSKIIENSMEIHYNMNV